MRFILSGYGTQPADTIAYISLEEGHAIRTLWQGSVENPSFVCMGDGYLFTITEAEGYAYVYMYAYSGDGFCLLDKKYIEGGYLCHITYSSGNKALFGACYGTGTIFSVRVGTGKFGELLYHEVQQGDNPEACTRAHCVLLNREETMLVTVNIALDRIYYYRLKDGIPGLTEILELPKGIGPRHALFSEDEKLLYIITEYSNEILVYENGGSRRLLQRISTLREGYTGSSNCSTICFSKDRRYLYAANRGAQTVTLFKIGYGGMLDRQEEYDCGGLHPRHMIISKDGRYLLVCNQNSDHLSVYELEEEKGGLIRQTVTAAFPSPSGIAEI